MPEPITVIISCEHASKSIPGEFRYLFTGRKEILSTHLAWDPGALELARSLSAALGVTCHRAKVSRLVIDTNRSMDNSEIFSKFTNSLPGRVKGRILFFYYHPFREKVQNAAREAISNGSSVLHISVHTFVPELNGEVRDVDIGLLYDPKREKELAFAQAWQRALKSAMPDLVVRRNSPYQGTDDSFISKMRYHNEPEDYIGLQLEVNQKFVLGDVESWEDMKQDLTDVFINTYTSQYPRLMGSEEG